MRKKIKTGTDKRSQPVQWVVAIGTVVMAVVAIRSCYNDERFVKVTGQHASKPSEKTQENPLPLSPEQIYDDVSSRVPLQQADAIRSYVGNQVVWSLRFVNATEDDGIVKVFFSSNRPVPIFLVRGEVKLSEYPWLKVAKKGIWVLVRGTIKEIHLPFGISLKNISLELSE